MHLPRSIGLVDLAVLTVVLVMVVLPPREMYATNAHKGSEPARFALALAEARTLAQPTDGELTADLGRLLGEAGFKDWAIEATVRGAARAQGSPDAWKALLAASVAFVDRIEVVPALDYANQALAACRALHDGCPSFEEVRMSLYQAHLDSGVKSGIDPRKDPRGFRAAGEGALRRIWLNTREREPAPPRAPAQ
jgi:hypothetical protein